MLLATYIHTEILLVLAVVLSVLCVALASAFAARAPAASIALVGLLIGGVGGFAAAAADGPKFVPEAVALWASVGVGLGGLFGLVATRGTAPSRAIRRAALWTLGTAPFAGAALTFALQAACPLYVTGKKSSYCNYGGTDVLGAWVSEVVFLFMAAAVWLAIVLWISHWQAEGWPGQEPKG
jgi:hypothetical protein